VWPAGSCLQLDPGRTAILPAGGLGMDRTYERRRALWRGDALVGSRPLPLSNFAGEPALSLSKRGDQSYARGRSNAVQATLARMVCPPVNRWGRKPGSTQRREAERGTECSRASPPAGAQGNPVSPVFISDVLRLRRTTTGMKMGFSWEGEALPNPPAGGLFSPQMSCGCAAPRQDEHGFFPEGCALQHSPAGQRVGEA